MVLIAFTALKKRSNSTVEEGMVNRNLMTLARLGAADSVSRRILSQISCCLQKFPFFSNLKRAIFTVSVKVRRRGSFQGGVPAENKGFLFPVSYDDSLPIKFSNSWTKFYYANNVEMMDMKIIAIIVLQAPPLKNMAILQGGGLKMCIHCNHLT